MNNPPTAIPPSLPSGIDLISAERVRQIQQHGWTPEHDASHERGQMLSAAIAYATATQRLSLTGMGAGTDLDFVRRMYWPWEKKWWKPGSRVRNLVKAGALIAAEIDRLQKAGEIP